MRKKTLTAVLFLFCLSANAGTQLKVIELSTEESAYELSKVQHIDFTNNQSFSIIGKDGQTLNKTEYGKTKAIVFNTTQSGAEVVSNTNISVYPNPTQDAIHISGAKRDCGISIYNNLGQTVYNATTNEEDAIIEVANLRKGTYLLKVGNKVVKFIKE